MHLNRTCLRIDTNNKKLQAAGIYYKQQQRITLFYYPMNALITTSWNIQQATSK